MFCANSLTFGQARARYGPVPDTPRRVRKALARFLVYVGKAALARVVEILAAICRAVRAPFTCADYDWRADTNVYPLDTQTFLSPGQALKQSAAKQEQSKMVLNYQIADTVPSSGPVLAAAPIARSWAGASTTPGLPNTIDTSGMWEQAQAVRQATGRPKGKPYIPPVVY